MFSNTSISFSSSHDSASKVVTGAVFVLLPVIAITVHSLVAVGLFALLLITAYAWSPSGYSISEGSVVVRRPVGSVRIPVEGLRDVRAATAEDLSGCYRVFGSGGLFGHYGIFHTSRLGKCTWYVTNRRRSVVLTGRSGTVVLSPDDVDGFIAAARSSATMKPSSPPTGVPSSPVEGAVVANRFGWIAAAVGIAAAVFAVASVFYAPGPPAYKLTSESLTIHDRFYPVTVNAASVDVESIRMIDYSRDTEWKPVLRTNGFGGVNYHSGWFRVASGKVVRMYRANSTRMVLLPPKGDGTAVLLETREPGKFVAEVREKWAQAIR
jgi:hypothetical protein